MRKLTSIVLAFTVAAFLAPVQLLAQPAPGGISGTATGPNGSVLANAQVQVLDANGKVVANTTSAGNGTFSVGNLPPGNYTVQILGPNGAIVGTSATVTVTAGAVATGVTVAATTAAITAAGLSAAALTAIVVGGVAVGVTTLVVVTNDDDSSASR